MTGKSEDDEDFKATMKSFKVYANKIGSNTENGYNIDHTSIVFLMGPNSEFIGSLNPTQPEK